MKIRCINAENAPTPTTGYSQALEVKGHTRTLFISGQTPVDPNGNVPDGFTAQCRLAWKNVEAQLQAAEMSLENVVKHTTFLADRRYTMENRSVRNKMFGDLEPALTVIIAGIFEEEWLVEIEAIAVA